MGFPFFKRKENTDDKPKRTRRVETTPDEDRKQRNLDYKKRIRKQKERRTYGQK